MTNDTQIKNNYLTYLRYSKVIKIISKKQCTAKELLKETKIPQASLYRILKSLLMNNIIIISKTKSKTKSDNPPKIFKLKQRRDI